MKIKCGISGAVKRSTHSRREKPRAKEARERAIKAKAKVINKVRARGASKDHATGAVNTGIVSAIALWPTPPEYAINAGSQDTSREIVRPRVKARDQKVKKDFDQ